MNENQIYNNPDTLTLLARGKRIFAKQNLIDFTEFTFKQYETNWHHRLCCKYIDLLARGEITRLMISMPPQHGKTELASRRFPAMLLGLNPDENIVACSHTADYASSINRDVQRIIDSEDYYKLFPETTLSGSNIKTNSFGKYIRTQDQFEIVGHRGSYKSAGVGGDITGRTASCLILDDPYKNPEEAWSKHTRNKIWEWYWTTFFARKSSTNVKILIIHTRWHEDDLTGRLLSLKDGNEWTVLTLPAICEEYKHPDDPRQQGEALWPYNILTQTEKFPLSMLMKEKESGGSFIFSALYQQHPQPGEGVIFRRTNFRYFETNNADYLLHKDSQDIRYLLSECTLYATMDLAMSTKEKSDYTVIILFAVTPFKEILILNVIRERVEAADHIEILRQFHSRYKPQLIGIESVQYQVQLVQQALRNGLPVTKLIPDKDKIVRSRPMGAKVEAHTVYFLKDSHWLDKFEEELLSFPSGTHDDQVDSFSYINDMILDSNKVFYADSKSFKQNNQNFNIQSRKQFYEKLKG